MRYLLDTCAFLYLLNGSAKLSLRAVAVMKNPANVLLLSSVSLLEIAIKHRVAKLALQDAPSTLIQVARQQLGIQMIALTPVGAAPGE